MTGSKQVCYIFVGKNQTSNKKIIVDICRNLREYGDNLQTDFGTILKPTFPACVAMDQEFQEPASLSFVSTEPIPRIHGARTYQRTRPWVPQFGKIIYRIFCVLSHFLFSIAFFETKMVHRVFSLHLGFAGI